MNKQEQVPRNDEHTKPDTQADSCDNCQYNHQGFCLMWTRTIPRDIEYCSGHAKKGD